MIRKSRIIDAFQVIDKMVLILEDIPLIPYKQFKIDNKVYDIGTCYDAKNCKYINANHPREYFLNKEVEFI